MTTLQFMTPPPNPRAFRFLINDSSITWGLENVYGHLETSQILNITCLPETIDMLKHIRSIYTLSQPDASRVLETIKYINNVFVNIKHPVVDGTVKELRIENNLLRNELQKLEESAKIKEKEFKETIQKLEESAKNKEKEFKETIQKLEESAKNKEKEFKETIQKLEEFVKNKESEIKELTNKLKINETVIKELNNDLIYFVNDTKNITNYKKILRSYKNLQSWYNSLLYKTHKLSTYDNDILYEFTDHKHDITIVEYNGAKYMNFYGRLFNLNAESLNTLSKDDILGYMVDYDHEDSDSDDEGYGEDEDKDSTNYDEYFLTPKGKTYHIDYLLKN